MPTSVDRIIAIAKAEIGYHEGRDPSGNWNNRQKYSPAVPGLEWSQNQAWCATFISWCAMKADLATLFPRTASTDTAAAWYKARKRWSEYPAIGAQGFLGVGNDMHHTFLVVAFDDTYVYTVEGNTNTNGSPQGDGVYSLKRRRRDANLVGYGYPAYPEGIVSADPAWRAAPKPAVPPAPARPLVTKRAPKRHVAHYNQKIANAGGTLGDSKLGSQIAHEHGYKWIDCNGHLTRDLFWVNAHGAPFLPGWMRKGDKFENHAAASLRKDHPALRDARATFRQNAELGLSTEWEVKDVRPLATDVNLRTAFARLRASAQAAYGDDWQKRVEVKVLTSLGGGLRYALRICKAAHEAGFTTIILPRGLAKVRRINNPAVTYNRGGRV